MTTTSASCGRSGVVSIRTSGTGISGLDELGGIIGEQPQTDAPQPRRATELHAVHAGSGRRLLRWGSHDRRPWRQGRTPAMPRPRVGQPGRTGAGAHAIAAANKTAILGPMV